MLTGYSIIRAEPDTTADKSKRRLSIALEGGANLPISQCLRMPVLNFYNSFSTNSPSFSFPFHPSTLGLSECYDLDVRYSLDENQRAVYLHLMYHNFQVSSPWNVARTLDSYASLSINSAQLGVEQTLLGDGSGNNIYGRLGLCTSILNAQFNYQTSDSNGVTPSYKTRFVNIAAVSRLGYALEFGARCELVRSTLALELIAAYTNVNLFGKSFTPINTNNTSNIREYPFNDAKNPDDLNDSARNIAVASLKVGLRLWL